MTYLTSLRGIAAVNLMLFHIKHHLTWEIPILPWIINNGFLAVDFFFVLSGFILGHKYHCGFRSLQVKTYYSFMVKRIARIYPVHLTMLLAFTVIPMLQFLTGRLVDMERFSLNAFVSQLFLVDAWGLGYEFTWNVPSWFISAQFLAFLSFPFMIYSISRAKASALPLVLVALAAVLAGVFYCSGLHSIGEEIGRFGIIRCGFEFSMGIIIFFIKQEYRLLAENWSRLLGYCAFLIFVMLSAIGVSNYFFTPIVFALLILALTGYSGGVHKLLAMQPLVFLGDISYSIYMTHYFIRDLLTMALLENNQVAGWIWICFYILVTLTFSTFIYKYIEAPGRQHLQTLLARPRRVST